jgi:ATP synthase F1 complex assembly factor 2
MQEEHWDPLFKWMKEEYGIDLPSTDGFVAPPQDPRITAKLRSIVEEMDTWELAGESKFYTHGSVLNFPAFERAVYASKSFVIALALCRGRLTAHEAAEASHVEVRSQIETWGEVEDSESGVSRDFVV